MSMHRKSAALVIALLAILEGAAQGQPGGPWMPRGPDDRVPGSEDSGGREGRWREWGGESRGGPEGGWGDRRRGGPWGGPGGGPFGGPSGGPWGGPGGGTFGGPGGGPGGGLWGGPGGSPWGGPGGGPGGAGFSPDAFLTRIDANRNGMIDPDEARGPMRFFLQRAVPEADLSRPIPIDQVRRGMERMRSQQPGPPGSGAAPGPGGAAPASGQAASSRPLVPGFGIESNRPSATGTPGPSSEKPTGESNRGPERRPPEFGAGGFEPRRDRGMEVARASSRKSYRFLSAQERLPSGLPSWFTERDANQDGQVSMAEYASSWTEEKVAEFSRHDLNGDGLITPQECLAAAKQPSPPATKLATAPAEAPPAAAVAEAKPRTASAPAAEPGPAPAAAAPAASAPAATPSVSPAQLQYAEDVIRKYDANGDKLLTADEWSKMSKSPEAADGNRDGKVTPTEYALWIARQ